MKAAEQQAEADGSPDENPECPQLSLSVSQTIIGEDEEELKCGA